MLELSDYWKGRNIQYPDECTDEIKINAEETLRRVNIILDMAEKDGAMITCIPSRITSGWRPPEVNDATTNAAPHSRHLTGQACDVQDSGNRNLARWCCRNMDKLNQVGLWVERFEWTPTWVHFQTVPPLSGHRFFIPSNAEPLVARLAEQENLC